MQMTKTPRLRSARRTAYAMLVCVLAALFAGPLVAGPAAADDSGAGVTHVEVAGDRLRVLVSVPAGTEVDLDGVTVQVDGTDADAAGRVRRRGRPGPPHRRAGHRHQRVDAR